MEVLANTKLPTKEDIDAMPFEDTSLKLYSLDDWASQLDKVIFVRAEQLPVVTYSRAWKVIEKLVKRKVIEMEDEEVVAKLTKLYQEREALLKKTTGIAELYKAF